MKSVSAKKKIRSSIDQRIEQRSGDLHLQDEEDLKTTLDKSTGKRPQNKLISSSQIHTDNTFSSKSNKASSYPWLQRSSQSAEVDVLEENSLEKIVKAEKQERLFQFKQYRKEMTESGKIYC